MAAGRDVCGGAEEGKARELLPCSAEGFCRRLLSPRHVPARTRHAPDLCTERSHAGTEPCCWHHPACTRSSAPAAAHPHWPWRAGTAGDGAVPPSKGIPGPQYFLLLTPMSSWGGIVGRASSLAAPAQAGEQTLLLSGLPRALEPILSLSLRWLRFTRKCRSICVWFPGHCVNLKVRTEESPVFPHPECNQLKFFCYDAIS